MGDTTHCETMPVRQAVDLTSIAQSNRYDCPAGILYAEGPQKRRPQNKNHPTGGFLMFKVQIRKKLSSRGPPPRTTRFSFLVIPVLDTGPQVIKLVANATQIPAAQWIPACAGMTIKKKSKEKHVIPWPGPRENVSFRGWMQTTGPR